MSDSESEEDHREDAETDKKELDLYEQDLKYETLEKLNEDDIFKSLDKLISTKNGISQGEIEKLKIELGSYMHENTYPKKTFSDIEKIFENIMNMYKDDVKANAEDVQAELSSIKFQLRQNILVNTEEEIPDVITYEMLSNMYIPYFKDQPVPFNILKSIDQQNCPVNIIFENIIIEKLKGVLNTSDIIQYMVVYTKLINDITKQSYTYETLEKQFYDNIPKVKIFDKESIIWLNILFSIDNSILDLINDGDFRGINGLLSEYREKILKKLEKFESISTNIPLLDIIKNAKASILRMKNLETIQDKMAIERLSSTNIEIYKKARAENNTTLIKELTNNDNSKVYLEKTYIDELYAAANRVRKYNETPYVVNASSIEQLRKDYENLSLLFKDLLDYLSYVHKGSLELVSDPHQMIDTIKDYFKYLIRLDSGNDYVDDDIVDIFEKGIKIHNEYVKERNGKQINVDLNDILSYLKLRYHVIDILDINLEDTVKNDIYNEPISKISIFENPELYNYKYISDPHNKLYNDIMANHNNHSIDYLVNKHELNSYFIFYGYMCLHEQMLVGDEKNAYFNATNQIVSFKNNHVDLTYLKYVLYFPNSYDLQNYLLNYNDNDILLIYNKEGGEEYHVFTSNIQVYRRKPTDYEYNFNDKNRYIVRSVGYYGFVWSHDGKDYISFDEYIKNIKIEFPEEEKGGQNLPENHEDVKLKRIEELAHYAPSYSSKMEELTRLFKNSAYRELLKLDINELYYILDFPEVDLLYLFDITEWSPPNFLIEKYKKLNTINLEDYKLKIVSNTELTYLPRVYDPIEEIISKGIQITDIYSTVDIPDKKALIKEINNVILWNNCGSDKYENISLIYAISEKHFYNNRKDFLSIRKFHENYMEIEKYCYTISPDADTYMNLYNSLIGYHDIIENNEQILKIYIQYVCSCLCNSTCEITQDIYDKCIKNDTLVDLLKPLITIRKEEKKEEKKEKKEKEEKPKVTRVEVFDKIPSLSVSYVSLKKFLVVKFDNSHENTYSTSNPFDMEKLADIVDINRNDIIDVINNYKTCFLSLDTFKDCIYNDQVDAGILETVKSLTGYKGDNMIDAYVSLITHMDIRNEQDTKLTNLSQSQIEYLQKIGFESLVQERKQEQHIQKPVTMEYTTIHDSDSIYDLPVHYRDIKLNSTLLPVPMYWKQGKPVFNKQVFEPRRDKIIFDMSVWLYDRYYSANIELPFIIDESENTQVILFSNYYVELAITDPDYRKIYTLSVGIPKDKVFTKMRPKILGSKIPIDADAYLEKLAKGNLGKRIYSLEQEPNIKYENVRRYTYYPDIQEQISKEEYQGSYTFVSKMYETPVAEGYKKGSIFTWVQNTPSPEIPEEIANIFKNDRKIWQKAVSETKKELAILSKYGGGGSVFLKAVNDTKEKLKNLRYSLPGEKYQRENGPINIVKKGELKVIDQVLVDDVNGQLITVEGQELGKVDSLDFKEKAEEADNGVEILYSGDSTDNIEEDNEDEAKLVKETMMNTKQLNMKYSTNNMEEFNNYVDMFIEKGLLIISPLLLKWMKNPGMFNYYRLKPELEDKMYQVKASGIKRPMKYTSIICSKEHSASMYSVFENMNNTYTVYNTRKDLYSILQQALEEDVQINPIVIQPIDVFRYLGDSYQQYEIYSEPNEKNEQLALTNEGYITLVNNSEFVTGYPYNIQSNEIFVCSAKLHKKVDTTSSKARRLALIYSVDLKSVMPCYSLKPRNDYLIDDFDLTFYVEYSNSGIPYTAENKDYYGRERNNLQSSINRRNKLYSKKLGEFVKLMLKPEQNEKKIGIKKKISDFLEGTIIDVQQFTDIYEKADILITDMLKEVELYKLGKPNARKEAINAVNKYIENITIYDKPIVDMAVLNKSVITSLNKLAKELGSLEEYTLQDYLENGTIQI